jgi:hypothetical protein
MNNQAALTKQETWQDVHAELLQHDFRKTAIALTHWDHYGITLEDSAMEFYYSDVQ